MKHLLIVDDEEAVCWALQRALTREGHRVAVAASAEEAFGLVAKQRPDAIVLDVRLPGLDGGEVYRRLRASDPDGRTPVLFLSAATSLDLYRQGIDDGVLLRKPYDVQDLVELVRALLTR